MISSGLRWVAAVAMALGVLASSPAAAVSAADAQKARTALSALVGGNATEAAVLARGIGDPLATKLVTWHRIVLRDDTLRFAEIAAFVDANPEWPWPSILKRRAEGAIDASVPPQRLVEWFRRHPPLTTAGRAWFARALRATGDDASARTAAREAWIDGSFTARDEADFMSDLGDYLAGEDHRLRLDALLWQGEPSQAQRMLPRVDPATRALAVARLDLRARRPGVNAAIDRVPPQLQNDPGLIYERVRWRRKNDLDESARALLLGQTSDVAAPELWWTERAILARRALADGHFTDAYRMASQHRNMVDDDYAEAEWLAGWIALRYLDEPRRAFEHFQAMYRRVGFPISLARGAYWSGRAAAATGDRDEAARWLRVAAAHPTTFYGQLAAATLDPGRRPPLPADPVPTAEERGAFQAHELTRAVAMLRRFGETSRLHAFVLRLAELRESPGWKVLAAELARDSGRADLGVWVGKQAYRTGHHLIDLGYPTVALPAGGRSAEPPLVLGVIRQESAFRIDAVSPAGARGLMQLMPATAESMAKQTGLPYSAGRLTSDPAYNITLGRGYLDKMLGRFGGSYVLSLAAYNAGPGRSVRWREQNGHPSRSVEDAVDWIEAIPFTETRNYVQRTLENLQVYRSKLNPADGTTLDRDLLR